MHQPEFVTMQRVPSVTAEGLITVSFRSQRDDTIKNNYKK